MARRPWGWRLLGLFWAAVLVALLGGGVVLVALGPPPAEEEVVTESPPDTMTPEPPPEAAPEPPPPPSPPVAAPPAPPPRLAFARPAPAAAGRIPVAIIAGGLGMSAEVTAQAIQSLPWRWASPSAPMRPSRGRCCNRPGCAASRRCWPCPWNPPASR